MAFETREKVLEKILEEKKPKCPHCDQEMNLWEVPPFNIGDGLGWGVPFLYLCFNDECSLYRQGWDHIEENYAHKASYRCMNYPGTERFEIMPVYSNMGGTGQIIDEQALAEKEILKEAIKEGFSILGRLLYIQRRPGCPQYTDGFRRTGPVRLKAAEMIGDIGELEAIEPIVHLKFGNELLQKAVNEAIKKIHKRFFTRECPFCAEIIKERAKVCKHCGQEVAGV